MRIFLLSLGNQQEAVVNKREHFSLTSRFASQRRLNRNGPAHTDTGPRLLKPWPLSYDEAPYPGKGGEWWRWGVGSGR